MYRQGDVLFVMVARLPDGKKIRRPNGHILEGEATGHVHKVEVLEQAEVFEIEDGLYLHAGELGVFIVHPEHAPVKLPPGEYRVQRQREYSPEAIRNVQD